MSIPDAIVLIIAAMFVLVPAAIYIAPDLLGKFINSDPALNDSILISNVDAEYIGKRAILIEVVANQLSVELNGSRWSARPYSETYRPKIGDTVVISGRDGLTLVVSPDA